MSQPIILVVDPNPLTHRRVAEAFADLRVEILSARDAQDAEQRARDLPIAVLLASTVLPRGNGYDLARALRAANPEIATWLLSGGFEVYNPDRAHDAGVNGNIPKPFSSALLRVTVASALGLGRPGGVEARGADEPAELPVEVLDAAQPYAPPTSAERIATFLPRDYAQIPLVRVDPTVVGPAMERAILEVLPEVVEIVLRRALMTSSSFRDLVETAVDEAVRAQLPALAERLVAERLAELEKRRADDRDAI